MLSGQPRWLDGNWQHSHMRALNSVSMCLQAKPGTIADYLNKAEVALDKVDGSEFAGGRFQAQIKRVEHAIDKVQGSGLI